MARRVIRTKKEEPVQQWEHREKIQQLLKIISVSQMDDTTKMVMRANIWGLRPDVFCPMTPYQIQLVDRGLRECPKCVISQVVDDKGYAKVTKCIDCLRSERRIIHIIERGKLSLQELLKTKTAQECVDAFNREESKYKNKIFHSKQAKSSGLKLIE